ncbi:MAG: 4-alpha-glucanotransferase [Ruminococcaceae bacterium]|nr:4-alpha-glucanotransferase [Oscillospiraceae bacterium]
MRTCGILMPIFSLSSSGGIGTLGKEAYRFVDFLEKSGQSWWQILPINPTNYGDSPYQSFSSYAGNPYFIDPELLIEEKLLTRKEFESYDFGDDEKKVDYGKLYQNRLPMLKKAYDRFVPNKAYTDFCKKNEHWLDEYALFMALKNANDDADWYSWDEGIRLRNKKAIEKAKADYSDTIDFYKFIQFKFYEQWFKLKLYANEKGIGIIGDIPIYVANDSADVWGNTDQFMLESDLTPKMVAGCPPDAFSEDGQLWGTPLYDWDRMKEDGYRWWKNRLAHALNIYDKVRIDHFRGFESFYAIPYGSKDAKNGKWLKGPDMNLFNEFKKEFGDNLPIIAEDLGFLTEEVLELLSNSGFPGMKVLQFAFDSREDSDYLPHNYNRNCVVYTGTHDNDTIIGWTSSASPDDVEMARKYLHVTHDEGFNWAMMRAALSSVADTCILMMHDFMGLGSEARINTPSTLGNNWQWRIDASCINDWLAGIIKENTEIYGRKRI